MKIQTHKFAIYIESFQGYNSREIVITDTAIYHRIVRVLRLEKDDLLILFNQNQNILTQIFKINKKEIILKVIKEEQNKDLRPNITFLLSILKPDAFEQAIYSCCELGANVIQNVYEIL